MLKNYLKIAFRQLVKNKTFSIINITGLTAGMVCCLYILLYIKEQYSYDKHHEDLNSIYRITTGIVTQDNSDVLASVSPPVAPAMQKEFAEVKIATRVVNPPDVEEHLLKFGENSFYVNKGYYVDSTFFRVFTYRFIGGSQASALDEPYSMVISSGVSEKLFGKENAIDQVITVTNRLGTNDFKITGVFDENFGRSHIRANFFMTMNSGGMGEYVRNNTQWAGQNFIYAYVKLQPHADARALEQKLPALLDKYGKEQLAELGFKKILHLQPVKDIHLHSALNAEIDQNTKASFLHIILIIAVFIQLIACINFMNLKTAQSADRAKEIGIRKTIGASSKNIIRQFLGESLLMACIAIALALPLLFLLVPWFNRISGYTISANFTNDFSVWGALAVLVLITGLIAGSYPAFYLSSFQVVDVVKGKLRSKFSSVSLRKGLVVFQFIISVCLIIAALVITKQVQYMQRRDLGFDKEQKIVIPFRSLEARQQLGAFKNEILQRSEVVSAGGTFNIPGKPILQDFGLYTQGRTMKEAQRVLINRADEDYFTTLDIPLVYGRDFKRSDTSNQVIVNQTALDRLKIKQEDAVGSKLYAEFEGELHTHEIIGVIKDFNYSSLHEEVEPLMFTYAVPRRLSNLVINVRADEYNNFIEALESKWKELIQHEPFQYSFLDENLQQLYETENTLLRIINSFTILAIFISCLGLFGLAAFTAEQRTKEIGIRKVLGASIKSIVSLLSLDFLKLVVIASIIAFPFAWFGMNTWLQEFAYRIQISWWVFGLASMIALVIAIITISYQAINAAIANPVRALRSE